MNLNLFDYAFIPPSLTFSNTPIWLVLHNRNVNVFGFYQKSLVYFRSAAVVSMYIFFNRNNVLIRHIYKMYYIACLYKQIR